MGSDKLKPDSALERDNEKDAKIYHDINGSIRGFSTILKAIETDLPLSPQMIELFRLSLARLRNILDLLSKQRKVSDSDKTCS